MPIEQRPKPIIKGKDAERFLKNELKNNEKIFKTEYLCEWIKNPKYDQAQILWLWYDYHTEMFDRTLLETIPSEYDKDCVIPVGRSSSASINYARNMFEFIKLIAIDQEIDLELLKQAKNDDFRIRRKVAKTEELYNHFCELNKMDFIFDYKTENKFYKTK